MTKPKIISIGSATFDTFLSGEALAAKRDVRTHDYVEQFPLGQKLAIEQVVFGVGGNSANAAVTFARQGFTSSFVGKIGDDLPGHEILEVFGHERIDTSLMTCDLAGMTSFSTILLAPNGERTILSYHGVSHDLKPADVNEAKLKSADWLYLSSLPADLKLLHSLSQLGRTSQIKLAFNPGSRELANPAKLKPLLSGIDILIGNKQELGGLFGGDTPKSIIEHARSHCPMVVLTDGPHGAWATDGQLLYEMGLYQDVKVVDRTGAGDAFGSGFVAQIAAGQPIAQALSFGAANATAVVKFVGAQAGILDKSAKWQLMPVKIHQL